MLGSPVEPRARSGGIAAVEQGREPGPGLDQEDVAGLPAADDRVADLVRSVSEALAAPERQLVNQCGGPVVGAGTKSVAVFAVTIIQVRRPVAGVLGAETVIGLRTLIIRQVLPIGVGGDGYEKWVTDTSLAGCLDGTLLLPALWLS